MTKGDQLGMLYVALGDSITHGYESTAESKRFVARIQRELSRNRRRVSLHVQARPGWTSKHLLRSLKSVPDCVWEEAKVITILVGGNDIIWALPWLIQGNSAASMRVAEKLRVNLTDIVRTVKRPGSEIYIGTIYNPFPNSLVAEECTSLINKSIRLVARRENLILMDLHKLFFKAEDKYIKGYRRGVVSDFKWKGNPIHPNDAGHAAIAKAWLNAYRAYHNNQKSKTAGPSSRRTLPTYRRRVRRLG